ncbi:MAG: pyridoxamine 5'-phosphate oxidase family protein [Alistipes sp.]|nr:pyridoxamine 5'-phosphate oxidase family protein [Candidatus Alistipes equi]
MEKKTNNVESGYVTKNLEGQQKAYDFIMGCQCYFLATLDGDSPRVRPFGTVNIFEDKLYIQTGYSKKVAKQILAHPKVEICAYDGTSSWIRISATLEEDTRLEAKKSMLDKYPSLRGMYSEDDDNTAVFFLRDAHVEISSFVEPKQEFDF